MVNNSVNSQLVRLFSNLYRHDNKGLVFWRVYIIIWCMSRRRRLSAYAESACMGWPTFDVSGLVLAQFMMVDDVADDRCS